jgi:hypothetical protein
MKPGLSVLLLAYALPVAVSAQLHAPFAKGASMGTLGAVVWDDGVTGRQPWVAAALLRDTLRFGLALCGIDYYDDMDNLRDRQIRHAVGGGWFHSRPVTVKLSYEQFSALDVYYEQTGYLSVGTHVLRFAGVSLDIRGTRAGIRGVQRDDETLVEIGATVWVPRKYAGLSLSVDHLVVESASVAGLAPDPVVRVGLHTRRHRWGAVGAVAEVVVAEQPFVRFAVGEELWVHPTVGLGAGLCTEPLMIGCGLTVVWRRFGTNVSFVHHPELGWSKGFTVDHAWR